MKPTPTNPPPDKKKKSVKANKPRAEYSTIRLDEWNCPTTGYITSCEAGQHVAVLPTATAKAAKLLVKVANMEPKARINWLIESLMEKHDLFIPFDDLRLILAALGFEPAPAKPEDKA